jgi:hypothetical protein
MGATTLLSEETLTVEPGGEADCEVRVRNTGSIVDQYTLEVLGDTAPWTHVEPATLSLFPGDEGVAHLQFRPPRDPSVRQGAVPFGLRVASKEDPSGTAVEEGTVEVGRFVDTFAELVPRTSRGRRQARHELAVDNRGNARVNAQLSAKDPDDLLRFVITPPAVVAEPGRAGFAKVVVRPRKTFLRGPDRTLSFQVSGEADGAPPLLADGSFVQQSLVPSWLPRALTALAVLALLGGIAWLTLLRPSIKSAAKQAVKEDARDAGAQGAQAALAAAGVPAAGQPAGGAAGAGGGGQAGGGGSPAPNAGTAPAGTPTVDGRLVAGGKTTYEVASGKMLHLTDIILQNPGSNSGTLQIQRNGTALFVLALDNFRDLDYHFVAPLIFRAGDKLELKAECKGACATGAAAPAVYWAGFLLAA